MITSIIYAIIAYFLGNIMGGKLLEKIYKEDLSKAGSGNVGARNAGRVLGTRSFVFVLAVDFFKGFLIVILLKILNVDAITIYVCILFVILGHIKPLLFNFKGGKGVATAFGAIAPISWGVAGSTLGTWLLVFLISRYSSLSAVITALLVPFYVWWLKPEFTFPVALVCCLLIYRHHDNIQRLWRGQEDKMWGKSKKK